MREASLATDRYPLKDASLVMSLLLIFTLPLTSRVNCGFEVLIPMLLETSLTNNWLLKLVFPPT